MIKVQEYKETNYEIFWGYLSVVLLVLFSSFSNGYFLGDLVKDFIALGLLVFVYLFRYRNIPVVYFKILLVFFAYNVVHYLIYHDVHPSFILRYTF